MPSRKRLIEGRCSREHSIHRQHVADIPHADVLIKRSRLHEHAVHVRGRTGVPAGDVAIEQRRARKHVREVGDAADVPTAHVKVEARVVGEGRRQIGYRIGKSRQAVKVRGSVKGAGKIAHSGLAPTIHAKDAVCSRVTSGIAEVAEDTSHAHSVQIGRSIGVGRERCSGELIDCSVTPIDDRVISNHATNWKSDCR